MGKEIKFVFTPLIIFFIVFFMGINHSLANNFQGSIHFVLPLSLGEFKKNMVHSIIGGGFSFSFGYKLGKSPFILGLNGKYIIYGIDSRKEYVYIPEFGEVGLEINYNYSIFQAYLFLRFQPQVTKSIHPYIDFMMGLNDISCHSSIPSDDDNGDIVRGKHLGDTALTYGFGGGFMIKVGASKRRSIKRHAIEHFIDIGVHYTTSKKKMDYLKKGSIVIEGEEITYIVYSSTLQMLTFHIGYVINF